jgi:hypothetical protein
LPTVNAATILARTTGAAADITLGGNLTSSATSGSSVILAAARDLINSTSRTITTAGTARWLIYSGDTADATIAFKGGLSGFNRYGCTYTAGGPVGALGTDLPSSGNGFFYAFAPTITVAGISGANKLYDGTTAGTLSGSAFLTGVVNGDSLTFSNTPTAVFADRNVGAGKTVTVTGYALTGTNIGYLFTQPTGLTADITVRPLTVTANPQTRVYGGTDPTLTYSFGALQSGDTSSIFTGSLIRAAGQSVAGSPYAITQGTLSAGSNYTINFTPSTLSITPYAISVTANPQTRVYGSLDPTLTYSHTPLTNGDLAASVFSGALVRAGGNTVAGSPYAITQGTLVANSNYTLTFTPSTFTITPYAISVTADPQTRVYGVADPTLTYTYSPLTNGDTAAGVFSGALVRAGGNTVAGSPYAITQGTLTSNSNYTISFTPSTLSITPADLVIRAQDQTRGLGDPNPPFTFTFTTLLLGDTPASITGLSATTTANTDSPPGSYPITPVGGSNPNYNITLQPGQLVITQSGTAIPDFFRQFVRPPRREDILREAKPEHLLKGWTFQEYRADRDLLDTIAEAESETP